MNVGGLYTGMFYAIIPAECTTQLQPGHLKLAIVTSVLTL